MKLKSIRKSNAKGYLILCVGDEKSSENFAVSEKQYLAIGSPRVNGELSEDAFYLLNSYKEYNLAEKRALGILSYGDNSEKQLINKLFRAGFSKKTAEAVTVRMKELSYIDEEKQLRRLIAAEVNSNLSGPKKYTAKLYAKGYSVSKIKSVTEELIVSGEIDFEAVKEKLIKKHSPENQDEKRKLLYKFGF